jgi:hypothetical protein
MEAFEVGFGLLRLFFDHAAEGFGHEGGVGDMKGDGYAATVGMLVATVAAAPSLSKDKAISKKRADDFRGGERPDL